MIRQRNPEVWFASWASSAPVQAQVDMSVYHNPIQQVMPSNCTADIHAAIDYVDEVFLTGAEDEIAHLRQAIYLTGLTNPVEGAGRHSSSSAEAMTLWDTSELLAYGFHGYQTHGFASTLLPFCTNLEQYNPSSSDLLRAEGSTIGRHVFAN